MKRTVLLGKVALFGALEASLLALPIKDEVFALGEKAFFPVRERWKEKHAVFSVRLFFHEKSSERLICICWALKRHASGPTKIKSEALQGYTKRKQDNQWGISVATLLLTS